MRQGLRGPLRLPFAFIDRRAQAVKEDVAGLSLLSRGGGGNHGADRFEFPVYARGDGKAPRRKSRLLFIGNPPNHLPSAAPKYQGANTTRALPLMKIKPSTSSIRNWMDSHGHMLGCSLFGEIPEADAGDVAWPANGTIFKRATCARKMT